MACQLGLRRMHQTQLAALGAIGLERRLRRWIKRKGCWNDQFLRNPPARVIWLTPERAVLVVPVLIGLGLSVVVLSVGITPLTLRVREQSEVVEELTAKADFVPMLRQQLAVLKHKQEQRDQQLDRLLDLVAGTSELQTFLAELNDMGRFHNVVINTTKPVAVERFKAAAPAQVASPTSGGYPLLNRRLEKRSAVSL